MSWEEGWRAFFGQIQTYIADFNSSYQTGILLAEGSMRHSLKEAMRVAYLWNVLETKRETKVALPLVLLTGETGTGKEIVARFIHFAYFRLKAQGDKNPEFAAINVANIQEEHFQSELEGWVKGAFGGATKESDGLLASNEIIFLDEVEAMPGWMQAAILRILETDQRRPLGGLGPLPLLRRAKFVCASNKVLKQLNNFRDDLRQRMSVLQIHIPPLRERRTEIPAMVKSLLNRLQVVLNLDVLTDTEIEIIGRVLSQFDQNWSGNVRQLYSVLWRYVVHIEEIEVEQRDMLLKQWADELEND